MSKDKKKKKADGKTGKKDGGSVAKELKNFAQNPVVAEVIAAALVAAAAALKDSGKARRLAEDAGDELTAMSKKSADRGSAMWQLALDIGRQTLETLADGSSKGKSKQKTS